MRHTALWWWATWPLGITKVLYMVSLTLGFWPNISNHTYQIVFSINYNLSRTISYPVRNCWRSTGICHMTFFLHCFHQWLAKNVPLDVVIYANEISLFLSNTDLKLDANMANISVVNWLASNKLFCNTDKYQPITLNLPILSVSSNLSN